jgi:ketosteroid isomerase-like protein
VNSRGVTASGALLALLVVVVVDAGTLALTACGGSAASSAGSPTAAPTTPTSASPANPLNLPSGEVMAALEGRIRAWMNEDYEAAAAYYAKDGILKEMDVTPHIVIKGRDAIGRRLADLYAMGMRLAPADLPLQFDRYVAEPTGFFAADGPQTGVGMLVFEMTADNEFAYQWVMGDLDRSMPLPATGGTPSPLSQMTSRPNVPSPEITHLLEARMAALNRGDAKAAASFYAAGAVMWEEDQSPHVVSKGRDRIAVRLQRLHDAGMRLEPAGASIQYDRFVAEPVRFHNADGSETGVGMLVFQMDARDRIVNQWVIATFAIEEKQN